MLSGVLPDGDVQQMLRAAVYNISISRLDAAIEVLEFLRAHRLRVRDRLITLSLLGQCLVNTALTMMGVGPGVTFETEVEVERLILRGLALVSDEPALREETCSWLGVRGFVLWFQGRQDEAAAAFDEAIARGAGWAKLHRAALVPVVPCSVAELAEAERERSARLDAMAASDTVTLDDWRSLLFDGACYIAGARACTERVMGILRRAIPDAAWIAPHVTRWTPPTARRIRIGVYGGGPGADLVGDRLDRDRFEVTAILETFSLGAGRSAQPATEHVLRLPIVPLGDRREQIAACRFDVLLYIDGVGTNVAILGLLLARLAPVQVSAWNPTFGTPSIDAYLAAASMSPPGVEREYVERYIRLPAAPIYAPRPRPVSAPRRPPGVPDGGRLYVCVQRAGKIHPEWDRCVVELLRRDPAGALVLVHERQSQRPGLLVRDRLTRDHSDLVGRIVVLPRLPMADYFALLQSAGAVLDTPQFSGGLTSLDALGLGVPVVTFEGGSFFGSQTAGFYRQLGVDGLIARDDEHYVELALRLTHDRAWSRAMSAAIVDRGSRLFDNLEGVRALEDAIVHLVDECARERADVTEPPGSLTSDPTLAAATVGAA